MDEKFEILDSAQISDEDLVRILTLDKEEHNETTLQLATREAAKRKLDLAQFIDRVQVSLNDGEPESCTIDAALAKWREETVLWHVRHFTNCLQEKLSVQKEAAFWTLELFEAGEYQQSLFIKSDQTAENVLAQFLRLRDEAYDADFAYRLDELETIIESPSSAFVQNVSQTLAAENIPHAVKIAQRVYYNAVQGGMQAIYVLHVLLPAEEKDAAQAVIAEIEHQIETLRQEIAALVEQDERHPQLLERYDELAQFMDGDAEVAYGRGVLLYERGRNEDAAMAFMQAAQLCMSFENTWPPEYLEESETYLENLVGRLPENLPLRHFLANLAMYNKNDATARERFERILAMAPADSIAHVNLGYLYAPDQRERARAIWHFQRYLELEPQAEDRAAIESMVAGL